MTHSTDLTGLLARLESAGVDLSLRLDIAAPDGAVDDDLLAELQSARPLLLSHLAREALWRELAPLRWGPSAADPTPGIDSRGPADPHELADRLVAADAHLDDDARLEREAIRGETTTGPYI